MTKIFPTLLQEKLAFDHIKLISSMMSDGIIIPDKTVRKSASSAAIYLPKKYVGHTFRIILLPETAKDRAAFKKENAIIERDIKIAQMTKQMKTLQTKIGLLTKKQSGEVASIGTEKEPEDAF